MLKTIPEVLAQAKKSLNILSATEAAQKCQQEKGIVIDVREPAEFTEKAASRTIPGLAFWYTSSASRTSLATTTS